MSLFPKCEDISGPVYVVYNSDCSFCHRTAKFFGSGWCGADVVIVSNKSNEVRRLKLSYGAVAKDVHVLTHISLNKRIVFSKGAACFFLISLRVPWFAWLYSAFPKVCEFSYWILKKIKVYL